MSRKAALQHNFSTRTLTPNFTVGGEAIQQSQFCNFFRILKTKSLIHTMEIPRLELDDPKLAKRVVDLVAPLVITAQKQEKMIEVLERELDMGLQHGLSGQASLERQIKDSLANNVCLIFHSFNLEQGKEHVNWLFMFFMLGI